MTGVANERGAAMMAALAILLMIGLIGAAVVQTSSTDMSIAENYQHDLRSFYAAEAGVEHTYAVLRDTLDWRDGFVDAPFAGGSYTVTLVDKATVAALDDTIIVTSTGTYSEAVSTVEVKLAHAQPFQWAAWAKEYVKLCGGTYTDSYDSDSGTYAATVRLDEGSVGSNGFMDICGTADVNGDASTAEPGGMDINGTAYVAGDTTTTAAARIFDPVSQAAIAHARSISRAPAGLSGTFSYNNGTRNLRLNPGNTMTMAAGTYYFNNVVINGRIDLAPGAQVEIYVVGDVDAQAHAEINMSGKPIDMLIYSTGSDIKFTAGSEITAVVYAPDVDIRFTGTSEFYGAFIANVAEDVGGSRFHYDRSLGNRELDQILSKVSWREL